MCRKWICWPMVAPLVALTALAGCTAGGEQPASARTPIPPPSATGRADCFYPREVQSFQVLDRSNLIVYAPGESRAYHVRISPPSVDLRNAERLAFIPAAGRICGYAGERLVVGTGRSGPPLSIIGISRLSPEGLEALRPRASSGAASGESPQPAPQPGDGPDIEDITNPAGPGTEAGEAADQPR